MVSRDTRHVHGRPASQAERAAAWLSLACAVHCLVVPVAMSVMPLVGASGIALGEGAHTALTLLVVASALLGVAWGYRRHRDLRVVFATGVGLCAYLVGHFLEGSWQGVALAVSGGLLLAASSFLGGRLAHHCDDASCARSV
jgi:hypothetical protein